MVLFFVFNIIFCSHSMAGYFASVIEMLCGMSGAEVVWRYCNVPFRKKICLTVLTCLVLSVVLCIILMPVKFVQVSAKSYVMPYKFIPIERSLNLSSDPCTNFYEFSCGSWSKNENVPLDKSRVTTFSMLQDFVNKKLKLIFETSNISNELPRVVNDAFRFYNICVNSNNGNKEDIQYLLNYFQEMGGWPILNHSWSEHSFNWFTSSAFLIKTLNIHPVIGVYSSLDDKNTSQNVIYIKQPTFFQDESAFLMNLPVFQMFYVILTTLDESLFNAEYLYEAMQSINETEVKWKTYFFSSRNKSEPVSFSFGQLRKEFPEIDFLHYINLIVNDTLLYMNRTIDVNDVVVIDNISYLKNVISVLSSSIFTKREIANLFGWFIVRDLGILIPGVFQRYAAMYGINSHELKEGMENKCFDKVLDVFECSLDYLYVKNSSDFNVQGSISLVGYLKSAFRDIIEQCDWLDDYTKQSAIRKLNNMQDIIGYQNYLNNKTAYDEMYRHYPKTSNSVLKTYFNIKAYAVEIMISDLKTPTESKSWPLPRPVSDVSAYYVVQKNALVFPLSLHQPPFYYVHGPWYLNFGAIGSIIGHEIMHGFDSVGCQRDERGNIRNWWSNMSLEAYKKRSMCFKNQYNSLDIANINVKTDGLHTLNEDIADCQGLKTAFLAYKKWVTDNELKEKHSNENSEETFTPEQMFFIAFASVWCAKISSNMRYVLAKDSHSFPEVRVNGAVSNSEYFAQVFNCPKGMPMNPEKKCSLW